MSDESTIRAILTQDGAVMIEQPDGSYRKAQGTTDWQRVNALTDAEIEIGSPRRPGRAAARRRFLGECPCYPAAASAEEASGHPA